MIPAEPGWIVEWLNGEDGPVLDKTDVIAWCAQLGTVKGSEMPVLPSRAVLAGLHGAA